MPLPNQFDPAILGGKALSTDTPPVFTPPSPAGSEVAPTQEPVPFAQASAQGTPSLAIGVASVAAARSTPVATMGESASAAFRSTSPFKVWEWANSPAYEPEPGYSPNDQMKLLDYTPSEDEDQWLKSSNSVDQWQYRNDRVKALREQSRIMGDHPVLSTIVSVADLGYFGLDIMGLGAARIAATVARAGAASQRLVATGVAGGGALALGRVEQQVTPLSDGAVVLNALVNAAATGLTYRAGKYEPVDAKYPADDLTRTASDLKKAIPEPEVVGVRAEASAVKATPAPPNHDTRGLFDETDLSYPAFRSVSAGATLDLIREAGGEFAELAQVLRQAGGTMIDDLPIKQMKADVEQRPYYLAAEHAIYVPEGILLDPKSLENSRVIVHEVAHGLTVQKIHYGVLNPDSAHGQLVSQLEDLRKTVSAELTRTNNKDEISKYLSGSVDEFAAGLFWGGSNFTYALSRIPVKGAVNALSQMVNVVRKMLGLTSARESVLTRALSITDDLIKLPLDATMSTGRVVSFAPTPGPNAAAQIVKNEESYAKTVGNTLSWNLSKTLSGYSEGAKKFAREWIDDPVDMTGDSVTSQRRAIRADFSQYQYKYEELLTEELSKRGAGVLSRTNPKSAAASVQSEIEQAVSEELLERYQRSSSGLDPLPKTPTLITKMADAQDALHRAALAEEKAAGVSGADVVQPQSGHFTRKWDLAKHESAVSALVAGGRTHKQAEAAITKLIGRGIARSNPDWTPELVQDVANAVSSRTRAKGLFDDASFGNIGNDAAREVREILSSSGISNERLQRALDVIVGKVDEAGKLPTLKHRIPMDMRVGLILPDGKTLRLVDLIDTNLTRLTEGYLDRAAGSAAMARKGYRTSSEISAARKAALEDIVDPAARQEASKLIDNIIADIKGEPVGEDMHKYMRNLQAVTQMVGLSASGLWQVTETANILAKYGMVKTVNEMVKTMPGFKQLLTDVGTDKDLATHLSNVLTRNSAQDVRIRPFMSKLEDNFDVPMGDAVGMALNQAKQLVPYINAMKYVQGWQARMVGNLVTDVFSRAAKGDAKAMAALNKYGLESQTMDGIRPDLLAGGLDTAKWSESTWAKVRGPLTKMMDDAVLRNRTGEIPAFAQFSQVGKFVFTFRSFVLGAHNKVLAGSLGREGFAGLGLLMAYQYPLTFLATALNQGVAGKDKSTEEIAKAALGQMGSLGLLGEFAGIISGEKQQFGAPGLIPIDRMYKAGSALAQGNAGSSAAALLTAMPILSIIPGTKALAETLKD